MVVDLGWLALAAQFASACKETCDVFPAADLSQAGWAVGEGRRAPPFEWNTAEPCDPWFPAVPSVGADL
ncbi:hypothetical protein GCM10009733_106000 [Nonomuraea maheshkhaliensis]|uniref:Secreted protein n=1 Tax=Nonomuraea maheshkhaliensis TaxID=419590 RepID=A0ABP4TS92_9ACTN